MGLGEAGTEKRLLPRTISRHVKLPLAGLRRIRGSFPSGGISRTAKKKGLMPRSHAHIGQDMPELEKVELCTYTGTF